MSPCLPSGDTRTRTRRPRGAHTSGSLAPNSATVGHPAAAARCETPESLPTNSRRRASPFGELRKRKALPHLRGARRGAILLAGPDDPCHGLSPVSASVAASSSKRAIGQFFRGLPLPGCTAMPGCMRPGAAYREAAGRGLRPGRGLRTGRGDSPRRASSGREGILAHHLAHAQAAHGRRQAATSRRRTAGRRRSPRTGPRLPVPRTRSRPAPRTVRRTREPPHPRPHRRDARRAARARACPGGRAARRSDPPSSVPWPAASVMKSPSAPAW